MDSSPDVDAAWATETETVQVGSPGVDPLPRPAPAVLGRYVVLEEVGQGGMGRVFRAYDPRLDRVVALKCLRLDRPDTHFANAAGRIIREARLMARLSHPNVVPVYDVEQAADVLFVAMEFVAGETLRDWLANKPSLREILAALTHAGRGLAAAHDAGIVHRDFKPTNVMVGRDGRARVMDFGISRAEREHPDSDRTPGVAPPFAEPDEIRTEVGEVVGTPVYMAPEQHAGQSTDPRSDQYSFCLVLFEAVYGCRPFTAREYPALLAQKLAGAPVQPTRPGVPRRVVQAIARGLSPDPEHRWPSMHALVDRIDPPLQRRPVLAAAAAVAIGVVAIGGYSAGRATAGDECGADALRHEWSATTRAEVHDAIASSPATGSDGAQRIVAALDGYVDDLANVVERRCAGAALESAGPAAREASARCVDHARTAMAATIELLGRQGSTIGPRAMDAVLALPDPRACVDPDRLRSVAPAPDDPDTAVEVQRLRAALAEAKALEDIGEYATALGRVQAQREAVSTTGYAPLIAELSLREGALLRHAGDYVGAIDALRRSYFIALGAGHDGAALASATQLIEVLGVQQASFDDARVWIDHGTGWVERLGHGGTEEARLLAAVAVVDGARGRYDDAREGLERALALLDANDRAEHPDAAVLHDALGGVLHRQARLDDATDHHARALAIRETTLGSEHPDVATTLDNLGIIAEEQGRAPDAIDLHTRALAIREMTLGPEHPEVASTLINLGTALEHAGELPAARARLERAAALIERVHGPGHPRLGAAEGNLGNVEYAMSRWPEALSHYERALAIFRVALGEDHPDVAMAHNNVGLVALQLGRHDLARAELERALHGWQKTLGPDHPHVAMVWANLGESSGAAGRPRDAVIERARAREILLGADPTDDAELFRVTTALGEAHAELGATARARTTLEDALVIGRRANASEAELAGLRARLAELDAGG